MKKCVIGILVVLGALLGILSVEAKSVSAASQVEVIQGTAYDVGEKDEYNLSKAKAVSDVANRMYVIGDIESVSTKNGIVSYAVKTGNLKIRVDTEFGELLFKPKSAQDWHIITDKDKIVDATELSEKIGSGAIVFQTSKDGRTWINLYTETDIHNKKFEINKRSVNGEEIGAFAETTNVQLANGCYYRIIVAYRMEREVDPKKVLFVDVKQKEEKERLEVYQFYAYNPSVNQGEVLDTNNAYEFGDVYRVDSQDGFANPKLIGSDDPHIDWSVGKFYVSGYTDVRMDGDVPVFLKVPGDKAALWFNLEQELNKCNGRTDVKVNKIVSGSDIYFGTPTINNFGKGALIVRKTDKQNQKERQIYTNYLEATATVGANTRVDLFEEGDYEVALDYQLHYDKPFVFGTTTTKTLTYRVFFKFKVRNGDISLFLRDNDTNQFLTNESVAEHGFYIDVANSQYLNISIKREVLTESMNGLVEDTKFSGVAKEGRHYTDEGVYTVTVDNLATGGSVEKKLYVGNRDILRAHMVTGVSLSEINERMAAGAYISEDGQIIDPEPEEPEPTEIPEETPVVNEKPEEMADPTATVMPIIEEPKTEDSQKVSTKTDKESKKARESSIKGVVIFSVIFVLGASVVAGVIKQKRTTLESTTSETGGEDNAGNDTMDMTNMNLDDNSSDLIESEGGEQ